MNNKVIFEGRLRALVEVLEINELVCDWARDYIDYKELKKREARGKSVSVVEMEEVWNRCRGKWRIIKPYLISKKNGLLEDELCFIVDCVMDLEKFGEKYFCGEIRDDDKHFDYVDWVMERQDVFGDWEGFVRKYV